MSVLEMELVSPPEQGAEREMPDRRDSSPWGDPRLWVSILGVLLSATIAISGFAWSQLSGIRDDVQRAAAEQRTFRDTVLVAITKQESEDKAITERVARLESDMATQTKAYNFNFSTRLAQLEARAGVKPQQQKDDGGN